MTHLVASSHRLSKGIQRTPQLDLVLSTVYGFICGGAGAEREELNFVQLQDLVKRKGHRIRKIGDPLEHASLLPRYPTKPLPQHAFPVLAGDSTGLLDATTRLHTTNRRKNNIQSTHLIT